MYHEKRKIQLELTMDEHKLLIEPLNYARSVFIDEGKPTEDVNELLIKAMKAKMNYNMACKFIIRIYVKPPDRLRVVFFNFL